MGEIELRSSLGADMVEAASRDRGNRETRSYLGMSSIGDPCERKLWYGFRGYSPKAADGRAQMIFSLGDRVEEEVLKWLGLAGYEVRGRQETFSALNGFFRGHCDGIVDGVTKRPHVLEIKSANDARFKAFRTSGVGQVAPVYAAQVQCYMGYSGLERAVWVVMNKNTCEILTERVRFDRDEFERLEAKAARIVSANVEPERAFPENARECRWCDYEMHCRRGPFVQETPTCGTCGHCRFENLEAKCLLHDRTILKWGRSCPDWAFRDEIDRVPF